MEGKIQQLAAEKKIYEYLDNDLHFFFAELLRLDRVYTALDDIEHYQTTRLNLVFRRILLTIGSKLKDKGVVQEPSDVFFASKGLLQKAILEDAPGLWRELKELIERNKSDYINNKSQTPLWDLSQETTFVEDSQCLLGIPGAPGSN